MVTVFVADKTFNAAIFEYCKHSKLKVEEFIAKIPVDGKYAEMYDCAVKTKVTNLVSGSEEEYIFMAKKAKIKGYLLTGAHRIK